MKKNKTIIGVLGVIILIVGGVLVYCNITKDNKKVLNDLKIEYSNGPEVKVKGSKKVTKEITVENTSDELRTYSLEWIKVKNNYKEQNKLLYEIKGEGDYAADLGKSQIPSVGFKVFNSVAIQPKKTQKYIVTIYYDGKNNKDEKSTFEATLNIDSKVVDKNAEKKQEEEMKKQLEEDQKKLEKELKEKESKTKETSKA